MPVGPVATQFSIRTEPDLQIYTNDAYSLSDINMKSERKPSVVGIRKEDLNFFDGPGSVTSRLRIRIKNWMKTIIKAINKKEKFHNFDNYNIHKLSFL
jgi:hypothetical protein